MKIFTLPQAACVRICLTFIIIISLFTPAQSQGRMRANLYIIDNNGATLMDGNMTNYNSQYSNDVDGYDIWKMSNFGENFGIIRSSANLVIERRSLISLSDTTYFRIWNVQQHSYRIQVITENLHNNNLVGFIRDKFLNQDLPVALNDTTDIDFSVTGQAGSAAQDRFQLIYLNVNLLAGTLPVTFTSIQAQRKNNKVDVLWSVANEMSIEKYVVEQSSDAINFNESIEIAGRNNSTATNYVASASTVSTANYYRIKAISLSGKIQYSTIARVNAITPVAEINVYPNPVAGKIIQLEMNITIAGSYQLSLVDHNGRQLPLTSLKLTVGENRQSVKLPASISTGIYRLQVTTAQSNILVKTIVVL